MINNQNKKIILWILNFVLMFLIVIISTGIICAAVYFPFIWMGYNGAKAVTILVGIIYITIIIIKIIMEAMN